MLAGREAGEEVLRQTGVGGRWLLADGAALAPGTAVAEIEGPARAVLGAERTLLNLLCHLSGVATLTAAYAARRRPRDRARHPQDHARHARAREGRGTSRAAARTTAWGSSTGCW